MTHVTCRLTTKNRDQLRNPTLGNRVWATFTFTFSSTTVRRPALGDVAATCTWVLLRTCCRRRRGGGSKARRYARTCYSSSCQFVDESAPPPPAGSTAAAAAVANDDLAFINRFQQFVFDLGDSQVAA